MRKNGFLNLVLGLTVVIQPWAAVPAEFPSAPSEWAATNPPREGSEKWYAANASTNTWEVTKEGNEVRIKAWQPQPRPSLLPFNPREATPVIGVPGTPFVIEVSDGWIVAFNGGEWGGELWWFSPQGREHYRISEDQVERLIDTDAGLLGLEGLAHLSKSEGRVIKIAQSDSGRWQVSELVDLEAAPEAALQLPDGNLLVVTTNRLVRVGLDQTVEVLVSNAFWDGLYPNSIVRSSDGTIYVGMRHGVGRVTPRQRRHWLFFQRKAYEVDWLLPDRSLPRTTP